MTKITRDIIEQLRINALLPASMRKTDAQLAEEANVSRTTISATKHKLGLTNKPHPVSAISKDEESMRAFLQEYDTAPRGQKKNLIDKYGFGSMESMRTTVRNIRKKLSHQG